MHKRAGRHREDEREHSGGERPRLLAYLADAGHTQHVQRALAPMYSVIACESPKDIERQLQGALVDALILDRKDAEGHGTLGVVSLTRCGFPSVAIVLYCTPAPELWREILDFADAGIDEIVLRGADDLRGALQRTVASAANSALARHAMSVLEPKLSPRVADMVRTCLAQRDGRLEVEGLGRALGVTRKTLASWSSASGAPTPATLIGWSRVLRAARLLEDPGRSVEAIAHALHFGSASALNNMIRRYVGESPTAVRRQGAVKLVLGKWVHELERAT